MLFSTLFFDLDDTLYMSCCGLWPAIQDRMNQYMQEKVGIRAEDVPRLRHHYYSTYGTTLRGLQIHHQVDADDYLSYVHDIPLREYIKPDPDLRSLLLSLPQRRLIFTNADADHARRVMDILQVADCFEQIIDIRAIEFACKPEPAAYQRALAIAGWPKPQSCVLIDDSIANLAGAKASGLTTVLVNSELASHPSATITIPGLLELPKAFPELWKNGRYGVNIPHDQ